MSRILTAAALAATVLATALPASAQAATVEGQIGALIAEKAQTGSKTSKGVLLPLKTGAISYAKTNGIAALEATGEGTVQVWGTGGMLSLTYWTDASRSTTMTLGCNQNFSTTTCEIR